MAPGLEQPPGDRCDPLELERARLYAVGFAHQRDRVRLLRLAGVAAFAHALQDVAAKYKGKGEVADTLVTKLKSGKGHMKVIASDADLQAAVKYILEQQ